MADENQKVAATPAATPAPAPQGPPPKKEEAPVVVASEPAFNPPVDPTEGTKLKQGEQAVLDPDGEVVVRKSTFAELGLNTDDEDMSKFIPPVAPSNAPQPKTYVGRINIDHVPSEREKNALKQAKKDDAK